MLVGFDPGEGLGVRAGPVNDNFFDGGIFAESEVKPAGGLGEEGLAGVEGAEVGKGLILKVDFDPGADGVARGGFGGAGQVEGEEV